MGKELRSKNNIIGNLNQSRGLLDGFKVIYFSQEYVLTYLQEHPEIINHKKFHELLVGWILAQFLSDAERKLMHIGFPLGIGTKLEVEREQPDIRWILDNYEKIIEDLDVDICVGNNRLYVKFQITRFIYFKNKRPHRQLIELIREKCKKHTPDPRLYLVISIESIPNIDVEELKELLTEVRVPFAGIILIMKASERRGHFSYCMLYPKPTLGKAITIPLPV